MKTILLLLSLLGLIKFADPTCDLDPSSELPEVETSIINPDIDITEVDLIMLAQPEQPLNNILDIVEWMQRLKNEKEYIVDRPDNIRFFYGIGEYPPADVQKIKISKDREVSGEHTHTVTFEIDDITDTNYQYMLRTYCGVQNLVWFGSGDKIYGGNSGILASVLMKPSVSKGKTESNKLTCVISWETKFPPERNTNVLSEEICENPLLSAVAKILYYAVEDNEKLLVSNIGENGIIPTEHLGDGGIKTYLAARTKSDSSNAIQVGFL